MGEVMNTMGTEPTIISLSRTYINRTPVIQYHFDSYIEQKRIERTGTRVNLALRTTNPRTNTNSKKEQKQRRDWIVQQRLENRIVEGYEIQKSPVYRPINHKEIMGPYTVNANTNREVEIQLHGELRTIKMPRIEKMFYEEKEGKPIPIYFAIAHAAQNNQDYLVVYSTYLDKNKQRIRKIYSIEEVGNACDNTACLKNMAKERFLKLLGYNLHNIRIGHAKILQVPFQTQKAA